MAYYLNHELEYVLDDFFDMIYFENESMLEDNPVPEYGDDDMTKPKTDTSALEYHNGKDIQGIPWARLNYSRNIYRENRLKLYKNYESVEHSRAELEKECKQFERNNTFYNFKFNTRTVKPTITHFQLRNLIWATSKHDVYLLQNYSVMHWSSLLRRGKEVLNVAGHVAPTSVRQGSMAQSLPRVQISTMLVKDRLLVAGGLQGELFCKHLDRPGLAFFTIVTSDDNAITNSVDMYDAPNGSIRLMAANNDRYVRIYDMENFAMLTKFSFPWSVNSTSISLNGKLLTVLGDSRDCVVADPQTGKVVQTLKGHLDYNFASAWHPDGLVLATGSQDTTCRLWDTRNLSRSLAVLRGRMGAIRGIKFSSDGRFMAMAEPADFVHVFDTKSDYVKAQEIDLFWEIAGISFSPDAEALFVGVVDRTYGSLVEFNRRRHHHYLDCFS